MKGELFAITEYCIIHNIDPAFLQSLEDEGIIDFEQTDQDKFVDEEQLRDLELFTRWYSDLGVNAAGIDVIRNLLGRIHEMEAELRELRSRL